MLEGPRHNCTRAEARRRINTANTVMIACHLDACGTGFLVETRKALALQAIERMTLADVIPCELRENGLCVIGIHDGTL